MHAFHVTLSVVGAAALVWGYLRLQASYYYRGELTASETQVWKGAPPAAEAEGQSDARDVGASDHGHAVLTRSHAAV